MLIILALWIAMFFVPHAKASAPDRIIKVPQELLSDQVKTYAYKRVADTWGEESWNSFNNIITRESSWDCTNQNPKSSAFGLGQLLSSTRKYLGLTKTEDCQKQVDEAVIYILDRYKNPDVAWTFWKKNLYY